MLTREETPRLDPECTPDAGGLPSEESLVRLGQLAMRLEEAFGRPQDIEWAEDVTGELYILQTRPLQEEREEALAPHEPLPMAVQPIAEGLERASTGAGCGNVYFASTGERIAQIPEGAVVVTPSLKPSLLTFIGRMNGVIAATGSRASHFASVARESGVPVVVGDVGAKLEQGRLVTVDGTHGAIYEGCVESIMTRAREGQQVSERVVEQYAKVAPLTVRLNLTDPQSEDFTPIGLQVSARRDPFLPREVG